MTDFWKPHTPYSKPQQCKHEGCHKFGWYMGFCQKHRHYGILHEKEAKEAQLNERRRKDREKKQAKRDAARLKAKENRKKERTAMKKRSIKRKSQEVMYTILRKTYLDEHQLCEICSMDAHDIHHKRGRTGEKLLESDYFMAVCRPCHDRIHNNPAWAYEHGYLLRK